MRLHSSLIIKKTVLGAPQWRLRGPLVGSKRQNDGRENHFGRLSFLFPTIYTIYACSLLFSAVHNHHKRQRYTNKRQQPTASILALEQKVVLGGDRPELRKSWPDRLCKLLTAGWHADHTKRPTATEIVTVLKIVHAELAPRAKRRPSYEAAAAAKSGGGAKGSGSGDVGRRHSWTPQVSSTTTPSALGITRAPSGSGTTVAAPSKKGNGAATRPLSSSFAPIPPAAPTLGRKHASLPVPLTPSSHSTSTRRRWFLTRKKAQTGATPRQGVGSEPRCFGGGAPSGQGSDDKGAQSGRSPGRRRRSRSVPEAVVAEIVAVREAGGGDGEENFCGVDVDAQGRAPEWTATTGIAGGSTAAGSAGDDGRVCRCKLHQTLVSQREMIADALSRETEGLMSPARVARVLPPRTTAPPVAAAKEATTTAPDSGVRPEDAGGEKHDRHIEAITAVLDVSNAVRRNSSIGKLWPSTSSSGRNTKDEATASAATVAPEAVVTIQTTALGLPVMDVGDAPEDAERTVLTE